jgi:hypothetical protein
MTESTVDPPTKPTVAIKHRVTGRVLFESEAASLREAVIKATKARADLKWADLKGADLKEADLKEADLDQVTIDRLSILPAGDLIGWKKCRGGVVVRLGIPADAGRSNATGRKCRAEYAVVLELIGLPEGREAVASLYDPDFFYRAGKTVRPSPKNPWDDCRWNECSGGIHFFITRSEAEAWDV